MIGVRRERSRPRMRRAVSKPSMPGMRTSSRITAKSFLSARRSASSPDCAIIRFWPSPERSSCRAKRLFGSSSTSRILACGAASASGSTAAMAAALKSDDAGSVTVAASDMSAYELVANGVVDEGRIAGKAELAQDARAIRAHRGRREPHLARDLADLLAGGEEPHHAVLAVGEFFVQRFLRIARAFARQDFGQRGGNVLAAVGHLAHRRGELLRRAVLGDVAGAACAQHARAVHVFGVHRQDQHRLAWKFFLDIAEEVEAAAARHGESEDRHVPFDLAGELEGLVAVSRFTDNCSCRIGGKHLLQTVTHYRVVSGYENSHGVPFCRSTGPCWREV